MLFYLPWIHQPTRVFSCKIWDNVKSVETIRDWVISQKPSQKTSTHWWYNELPENIHSNFLKIANCDSIIDMFMKSLGRHYRIDILDDMNEVYVSSPVDNTTSKDLSKDSSDMIFYTRHIDGPYFYIPFASCYRVIVGLDNNDRISTVFNMIPEVYTLKKCDVVAFDFHRECHYIRQNYGEQREQREPRELRELRVLLKIHYCVYPWWAYYIGKLLGILSIKYNKCFRDLFLFTLTTNSAYQRVVAKGMILSTKIFHDIEFYVGYNNISYVCLLYMMSISNYYIFLFGSSYIHYIRWIDSSGNMCNNLILIRDYNFYNALHTCQLAYLYYTYGNMDTLFLFLSNMITISYMIPFQYVIGIIQLFMLISLFDRSYPFCILNYYIGTHLILNAVEYNYRLY
jgi:hypothetical protein